MAVSPALGVPGKAGCMKPGRNIVVQVSGYAATTGDAGLARVGWPYAVVALCGLMHKLITGHQVRSDDDETYTGQLCKHLKHGAPGRTWGGKTQRARRANSWWTVSVCGVWVKPFTRFCGTQCAGAGT